MKAIGLKMAVCALAVVAFAGCESMGGGGVSDEELIKSLVDDAMAALRAGDIDAMMANYAETFDSDQGGGAEGMKLFLEGAKDAGALDDIQIDLGNLVITVHGNKASAKPIELEGDFGELTVEFDLEKIDGSWMVTYQTQF